ncbi:MAG: TrbI/VirB10 family protein [Pseudobdellovibrio sp.]
MIWLYLLQTLSFAQNNISEQVLDSVSDTNAVHDNDHSSDEQVYDLSNKSKKSSKKTSHTRITGNLDRSLIRGTINDEFRTPMQIPKNADYLKDSKLLIGTKFKALINSNIKAYANSISPIEALVLEGEYKGATLLGNATMDPNTKRIGIEFSLLRKRTGSGAFSIAGVVRDKDGENGLDGNYESFYWNYFAAETLLNVASGMANATTERNQQSNGGYVVTPTVDSASKQGVATGFAKSADRIGDRVRSAPEYVTARGPFVVQVLILK